MISTAWAWALGQLGTPLTDFQFIHFLLTLAIGVIAGVLIGRQIGRR